jgi:hypothetical protein
MDSGRKSKENLKSSQILTNSHLTAAWKMDMIENTAVQKAVCFL